MSRCLWEIDKVSISCTLAQHCSMHRAGIRHQATDALSTVKTDESDKRNVDEKLSVLMIDGTEEQQKVKTEIFD